MTQCLGFFGNRKGGRKNGSQGAAVVLLQRCNSTAWALGADAALPWHIVIILVVTSVVSNWPGCLPFEDPTVNARCSD